MAGSVGPEADRPGPTAYRERRREVLAETLAVLDTEDARRHGRCFAVLNRANARLPGGGYLEGYGPDNHAPFAHALG